jgi:hypothetical protein
VADELDCSRIVGELTLAPAREEYPLISIWLAATLNMVRCVNVSPPLEGDSLDEIAVEPCAIVVCAEVRALMVAPFAASFCPQLRESRTCSPAWFPRNSDHCELLEIGLNLGLDALTSEELADLFR